MSDSSPSPTETNPESTPETHSEASRPTAKNWPLWLGIGFFGLISVALLVSLGSLMRTEGDASLVADAPDPANAEANPQDDLRAHQALVSDVVADLGREVLIGDSPTKGNPDAEIVMLEFSDFQCPYCARASEQVEAFMAAHEEDVLLVFKHFPLTSIHPEAISAALASWAADQQGQFWEFHQALFANQEALGEELYVQIATDLGLDLEQFNRDRASEDAKAALARDLALVQELQLRSTPTFIMDTLLIPGAVPSEFFAEALTRLQAAQ
jgi:protein-disulfide isomerase